MRNNPSRLESRERKHKGLISHKPWAQYRVFLHETKLKDCYLTLSLIQYRSVPVVGEHTLSIAYSQISDLDPARRRDGRLTSWS